MVARAAIVGQGIGFGVHGNQVAANLAHNEVFGRWQVSAAVVVLVAGQPQAIFGVRPHGDELLAERDLGEARLVVHHEAADKLTATTFRKATTEELPQAQGVTVVGTGRGTESFVEEGGRCGEVCGKDFAEVRGQVVAESPAGDVGGRRGRTGWPLRIQYVYRRATVGRVVARGVGDAENYGGGAEVVAIKGKCRVKEIASRPGDGVGDVAAVVKAPCVEFGGGHDGGTFLVQHNAQVLRTGGRWLVVVPDFKINVQDRLGAVGVLPEVADEVLPDGDRVGKVLGLGGAKNPVGAERGAADLTAQVNVGIQAAAAVADVRDGQAGQAGVDHGGAVRIGAEEERKLGDDRRGFYRGLLVSDADDLGERSAAVTTFVGYAEGSHEGEVITAAGVPLVVLVGDGVAAEAGAQVASGTGQREVFGAGSRVFRQSVSGVGEVDDDVFNTGHFFQRGPEEEDVLGEGRRCIGGLRSRVADREGSAHPERIGAVVRRINDEAGDANLNLGGAGGGNRWERSAGLQRGSKPGILAARHYRTVSAEYPKTSRCSCGQGGNVAGGK